MFGRNTGPPFSLSEVEGQGLTSAKPSVRDVRFDFAQRERRLVLDSDSRSA
ncbi:hypothetical protein SUS17_465 [Sphingomonas sp. S17]|jgi:hypothetical protein|nr:hypothetical protein SUS17_465 [Sphingomonas sp. S17]